MKLDVVFTPAGLTSQEVQGRTVFVIAHRFSTIRDASMILVFQDARIVAHGSHESLYESSALYKALYDRQRTAA